MCKLYSVRLLGLCLDISPEGSLLLLGVHSFASNSQLALLESVEEGKHYPRKNVSGARVDLEAAGIRSGHVTDRVSASGRARAIHSITTLCTLSSVPVWNVLFHIMGLRTEFLF